VGAADLPCPQTYSTVSLPDGTHTIAVRAKDTTGTVDPTPATYTWVIDTMPPDTTILTSEPNPTNDPTQTCDAQNNPPAPTRIVQRGNVQVRGS